MQCVAAALVVAVAAACGPAALAGGVSARTSAAVVKLHVTTQQPDYNMPWQAEPPMQGSGSGFVIGRKRILTNAHVVSDLRFLQVQKENDPRRYPAKVRFIGHDCDLAVIDVEEGDFYDGVRALEFARRSPGISDEVVVIGYPMGGERLSVTRGVVSRVDYGLYAHSGVDQHLVLQVDAAINPGNSGGPVLQDGRVVGLAFQGLSRAENIGYAIPLPVIAHFLEDIEDGRYDGYPELGVAVQLTQNRALRLHLGIPAGRYGVAVTHVDPFGSARELLHERDAVLAIDGREIADDGTILVDGERMEFAELVERKQWGSSVEVEVWRSNALARITVPLRNLPDPFLFRNRYDERPSYLVRGGMVFSPLTGEYLRSVGKDTAAGVAGLSYCADYAKIAGLHRNFDEFVVFIRRLAHPLNAYADRFLNGVVVEANGRPVRRLADLKAAWQHPQNGFHVLRFEGSEDTLVVSAREAEQSHRKILADYGVPQDEYLEATP